jgi:SAM-dependent methyltransferase
MTISSFDALGERYNTSRYIPSRILRSAMMRVLGDIDGFRHRPVLECGCGTGQVLDAIVGFGRRLVGADLARNVLTKTKLRLGSLVSFVAADGRQLSFRDSVFGAVVVAHVLEHVAHWELLIEECMRVVCDDGCLVLLFSPGFIRNLPRCLLKQRLAAKGRILTRPGIRNRSEVEDYLNETGRFIVKLTDPLWTWVRSVPLGESLEILERNEYSLFWSVPGGIIGECLKEIRDELSGRLSEIENVSAKLEVWLVRKQIRSSDGSDAR